MAEPNSNNRFSYDVFVSYNHKDKDWVRGILLPYLENEGLRVCIDHRNFEVGVPALVNMENAVDRSRKTLLILTPDWIQSNWTEFEALLIQTTDPVGRGRRILPVMLRKCDLPLRLGIFTYLDLTDPAEFEFQMWRLIAAIRSTPQHRVLTSATSAAASTQSSRSAVYELNYERGLAALNDLLSQGDAETRLNFAVLESRLLDNLQDDRRYGQTETIRSDRARIIEELNRIALACGVTFNDLCKIRIEPTSPGGPSQPVEQLYVVPLGTYLTPQNSPPNLPVPPGYCYLGQLDGLLVDHWYREQDRHIALQVPAVPGVFRSFLIDKYAITAQQFSDFLNDMMDQGLAQVEQHATSRVRRCVDKVGRILVYDALDRWQNGASSKQPWKHAAPPWGLTYPSDIWQPIPGSELLPATFVTWWGAQLYSQWAHRQLSITENEISGYLPTVRQWQTAAVWDPIVRHYRSFPWGETWQRLCINYAGYWAGHDISDSDWEKEWANQSGIYRQTRPLPVADLKEGRSPIGCLQLLGNVFEWCADNPEARELSKAVKGGACLSTREQCDVQGLVAWRPEQGSEYIGFRCCCPTAE
jgi:formylglycine-generating enzyme required for sulfatase activity